MAFRTFRSEAYYEAPDATLDLSGVVQAYQQSKARQAAEENRRRTRADQFTFDAGMGKYSSDQEVIDLAASGVNEKARIEILQSPNSQVSYDTQQAMQQTVAFKNQSVLQWDQARKYDADVNSDNDIYRLKNVAHEKIRYAEYGEANDVTADTRGDRLTALKNEGVDGQMPLGAIDEFNFDKFKADYVKSIPIKDTDVIRKGDNYATQNLVKARFRDENNKPGVTDKHANDFLKSDQRGRVQEYYDVMAENSIESNVQKMLAEGNNPETAWLFELQKTVDDPEEFIDVAKARIIANPELNSIDSRTFARRKLDMAKYDLEQAQELDTKISTDYSTDDSISTRAGTNKDILHTYTFNSAKSIASREGSEAKAPRQNGAPGGVFTTKVGKPVKLTVIAPVRGNVNTGEVTTNNIGQQEFNLTGYQIQMFSKSGRPIVTNSTNKKELLENINRIPFSAFDPSEKEDPLAPTMDIAFMGYTVDRSNILNDVNKYEENLDQKIASAKSQEEKDQLENQKETVKKVKDLINSGADDDEITQALYRNKIGVSSIQNNEIFKATDQDLSTMNALSGGFDLRDKNNWSDDMIEIADAYETRYQQAKEAGFKQTKQTKSAEDLGAIKLEGRTFESGGKTYTLEQLKEWYSEGEIRKAIMRKEITVKENEE